MSIRRDLLLRTALLRLPEPPPARTAATNVATPAAPAAPEPPAPRRASPYRPGRRPAKG